ncbi:ParA family protein [Reinekea marinisedimentorum]|uniref:Chromosome partitioning protein n=1 Tax=Reinekea marinisedimentorum TaxID=230495 RepID=A0A4R3IBH6_9GAMM|nr:ParA family protein [Reinekea marinisedimentorum]TCS43821.1 chromosome partitioning protein [Reinekea marinisedimentorum]
MSGEVRVKEQINQGEARTRVINAPRPTRILIANAKGGSGKTTIATNLASLFAARNEPCALIDFDPQGSASQWLQLRQSERSKIHGVSAYKKSTAQMTRTWYLRNLPAETTKVVMDTPAGLSGMLLNDLVRESDFVIIPVTPSPIDIRATTNFIKDLFLTPAHRTAPKKIAVVANRVRKNTLVYAKLELFLKSLKIPFISSFRDTQYYIRASEYGLGIHDLKNPEKRDVSDWLKLVEWIDSH